MVGTVDLKWPSSPPWLKGVGQGRSEFLSAVPTSLVDTTCRCSRHTFPGWGYNEVRQMWTCGECDKPSPAHMGYNVVCMWCEQWFTIWKFGAPEDAPIEEINAAFAASQGESCRDCGGDNDARIYSEELI